MEITGVLVGVGGLPWDNRQTGETGERNKVSISQGMVSDLPKLFDITDTAMRQALGIPFGSKVVARMVLNRYNQLVASEIVAA